jgi:hypothetical protein
MLNRERWILRQFKRRAHLLLPFRPASDQQLEWLAIIQHHGGPTRLLDFTRSFYIAAYFALDAAAGDAAVWAIDLMYLNHFHKLMHPTVTLDEINEKCIERAEDWLKQNAPPAGVVHVEPERLNERMSLQQGMFLLANRSKRIWRPASAPTSKRCITIRSTKSTSQRLLARARNR